MAHNVEDLTELESDQLIDWFLTHMNMDTRNRLMADMPQTYLVLYGARESTVAAVLANVESEAQARAKFGKFHRVKVAQ